MSDFNASSHNDSSFGEAFATAPLVLPLIASRFQSDPLWSLAMLEAVRCELLHEIGETADEHIADLFDRARTTGTAASSLLTASDALGLAHRYAMENELPAATAMAELALCQPGALGESEANALVLLASLRERQGQLELAAQSIAAAARLSPNDEGIMVDQERILTKVKQAN